MVKQNVKIVVYVPVTHAAMLREVIGKNGGGAIGNYSFCSFSNDGTGRFKPNDKANPFIGKAGEIEEVKEERIECICPRDKAKVLVQKIKEAHPYEEVAMDIYALLDESAL